VLGLSANHMERVPREKHGLARDGLSPAASKVCTVLREAGFSAYVVGGAVRDLLLGIEPKDFDVATDARPEQVKPLFRRALIIGRRFRLVHVMIGVETVEISTFRAADPDAARREALRQARAHARCSDPRADSQPRATDGARTAGAPFRRDAKAPPVGTRQRVPAPAS